MKGNAFTQSPDAFDLPVFGQPEIERPPRAIPWAAVMNGTEAVRRHFLKHFDNPETRLRDKNPKPFRMD